MVIMNIGEEQGLIKKQTILSKKDYLSILINKKRMIMRKCLYGKIDLLAMKQLKIN